MLERIYVEGVQENPGIPTDGVPALLRQAVPVHEVVKVDLHVPGCPPPPRPSPTCWANCWRAACRIWHRR
jgi:coenzyme F420-reducing hydrogenase gamma subunit